MATESEYLRSFICVSEAPRKKMGAKNSDKFCIVAEDFEDRRIGTTSQKLDFKPIENFTRGTNQHEIKVIFLVIIEK
jgi:hypothetical protein